MTDSEHLDEERKREVAFLRVQFNSEFPIWTTWEEFINDWWAHFQDIDIPEDFKTESEIDGN